MVFRYLSSRRRTKRIRKFGDPQLMKQLMPDVSKFRPLVKFILLLCAFVALVIVLARPQFGSKITNEKRTGIEAIICLDVSNSMMAEDVTPSRLSRSKMLVENLVDHFTNDKIGLIVFAGDAFIQLPITSDYVSAKMFLQNISPSMINNQGTNIAEALNIASQSFTKDEGVGKAIIVITDGEDHEGKAVEMAEEVRKKGMRVYMLGVGSPSGSPIPDGNGGYMKDRLGETVVSALNEDMCKQIASAGNGAYIHVDNSNTAQKQLDGELDKLSKKEINTTVYSEFDEQFQAFAIIALILLVLEICIYDRKNPMLRNISLFKRKKTVSVFILLMTTMSMQAQTDRQFITQGNRLFRQGKYAEAEVLYRKALEKNPKNPQAVYNLGNALLFQKKDSAALVQYQQTSKIEKNKTRLAKSFHNMGVIFQTRQMYQEAVSAYAEALRNNPNDDETRYNYVLCKHQLKNQQKNGGGGGGQDKNKDKNKQDKDKNKQDQNKDKQDQNKDQQDKNKDKQDQKDQQQTPQNQMSKENAEQLLQAAEQQEKDTQRKLKEAQRSGSKRQYEKNW